MTCAHSEDSDQPIRLVLLVKRKTRISYLYFYRMFMFLLFMSVTGQPTIKTSSLRFWDYQSAQSGQSLRCPHEEALSPWLHIMCTAKALIRQ